MLDNTLTMTHDGDVVTLTRINQQNFSSDYFAEGVDKKYALTVKHNIPQPGKTGESHMARLDVDYFDSEGVLIRRASAWKVIKTFLGAQDATASEDTVAALDTVVTSSFQNKLVGRES